MPMLLPPPPFGSKRNIDAHKPAMGGAINGKDSLIRALNLSRADGTGTTTAYMHAQELQLARPCPSRAGILLFSSDQCL